MHPRALIREAVAARLRQRTLAEDRVWSTMTPPISLESVLNEEGPVIMVYVRRENIKTEDYPASGGQGGVKRCIDMAIEALCVDTDADAKLDVLAEQIESQLESFEIASLAATEFRLTETQIDVTDALDRISGGVFMTYEVTYYTPYRPDAGADFLPSEVDSASQRDPREVIVDPHYV